MDGSYCKTWQETGKTGCSEPRLDCGLCCWDCEDHDAETCPNYFCRIEREKCSTD